ncbi:hypothetical protein KKH39_00525 [Patescibacteria group bacterium]|nr:hypothetical protein [Patescibacteria group bacterium]
MPKSLFNLVLTFVAVVVENLPTMSSQEMEVYVSKPEKLRAILRKAFGFSPVLCRVKLGTGLKTSRDFYQAFAEKGMKVDRVGGAMLDQTDIEILDQPMEVNVVAPTVAELGFKDGARYPDICQRGLELGYGLCPFELGPQLRLQHYGHWNEWLYLAMEPVKLRVSGDLVIFCIHPDAASTNFLVGKHIGSKNDEFFAGDRQIVFVCHR